MRIWADIDNAPHVLVLNPLIRELISRGHYVDITASDHGQTIPLLDLYGLNYKAIGRHAGKNTLKKIISTLNRGAMQLLFARKKHFNLAFCHGTRSIFIPVKLLRIPLVQLTDYEHVIALPFVGRWIRRLLIPEVISNGAFNRLGINASQIVKYPGLKEELYVYDFEPDPNLLDEIGVDKDKIIVLVRPPATMAHYHVSESEQLFWNAIRFLLKHKQVQVVLLPRTSKQLEEFQPRLRSYDIYENIIIPSRAIHGPNLIWNADLAISGGGTMNREAACMGVPVYSIYRGPLGAVDRYLSQKGKLKLIENTNMIEDICLEKRIKSNLINKKEQSKYLRRFIVDKILEVAE